MWFARHGRDLPWRHTSDPYAIWVSEIMLQQTQVTTVIPYYVRFLETLPTIADLAAAPESLVLRLWEGLGYYRRARSLHAAARLLVRSHGGRLPDDMEVLASLPGMGKYTVGAVLSQAFDHRLPILEANSRRLLARFFAEEEEPAKSAGRLWGLSEILLPRRRVGAFNQALMEVGALVCTSKKPNCNECPLQARCLAHARGLQDELPRRAAAPRVEHVNEVAVVPTYRGRVLIVRRPEQGRWAGLWEFPHGPIHDGETASQAARRVLRELLGLLGRAADPIATLNHAVTRFRIEMTCLTSRVARPSFRLALHTEGRWLRPRSLTALPLSAPQRRLADKLVAENRFTRYNIQTIR
jgi:A/G-specific adenine glycosylase